MKQREIPKSGEFYRHFKGKYYQIITVASHTETEEKMVVYQALYDDFGVYARPLQMFLEKVEKEKYPDVLQEYRFERVERPYERKICTVQPKVQTEQLSGNLAKSKIENAVEEEKKGIKSENTYVMDSDVERFLDASTYKDKLNILMSLRNSITEKQLHDMAVTLDLTIDEGNTDDKFLNLVSCLRTMARFEVNR